MNGFGGVVSFEVDGDLLRTAKFVDALKIPKIAPSFGGCESIVDQPAIMSYWKYPSMKGLVNHQGNLYVGAKGPESFLLKSSLTYVDFGAKQLLLSELASYSMRNQSFKEEIVDKSIYYGRTRDMAIPKMIL
ncbi:cystathionine gamma-synthase 1, chloroplastic-like [Olea europaea subsp. europaea]|uniref:Cystathionine gamma-synthase 1, chloroplastic-like n=1 Tax=Olea europaea subsp. europaea TaxID=158383 RepID=A0A8S0V0S5_OLEEU|nr:cystathionine gamma-synthase 1, chloroplastic-like [Olea europaea subsp. europaea]